jgi:hypothetical protein
LVGLSLPQTKNYRAGKSSVAGEPMKLTPLGRNDVPKPVGRWPGPHSSHWDDDSGAFGQLATAWSSG